MICIGKTKCTSEKGILLICCVKKFKLSCVISKVQNGGKGGGTKVLMSERDKMVSEKPRSY